MTNKIGRPKVDNPKNIDIKVRFDESTNKKILTYCEEKNITRASLIRESIRNQITLNNGLEKRDIENYESYLEQLKKQNINSLGLESVELEISNLTKKLDELYGILDKLRDKYLYEEYGIEYDEVFKKGIKVEMPINSNIFFIQKEYYKTLTELYDIRYKLKY